MAFLSLMTCRAAGNEPDSHSTTDQILDTSGVTNSQNSNTSNSTRPSVDTINDSSAHSASNKRRFGANTFIGAAVRSSQQAVFKSLIDDVSVIGSPVQTKVLDSKNFGFPIEGPSYVQIKSGDSRTKTFFDSPPSGFVSSNDGIGKETHDSGLTNMFDRGGFTISFNLDSKQLNGTNVILSWTDQLIGMDYDPYGDSFQVYISHSSDPTRSKRLVLNETITSYQSGSSSQNQTANTQPTFKSSGLKQRTLDMSSYMDQKIIMEFVVADKDDQVVDVACALDDFHWRFAEHMRYHSLSARSGIPGIPEGIPGYAGGVPSFTGGVPGPSDGMPSPPAGMPSPPGGMPSPPDGMPGPPAGFPGLSVPGGESGSGQSQEGHGDGQSHQNGRHSGYGLPVTRRSNHQDDYQQFHNSHGSNYNSLSNSPDDRNAQDQGGRGQQDSQAGGVNPPFTNQPSGQGGSGSVPPFAENHIPHIFRRDGGGYLQGYDANGHQYGGSLSYGNSPGQQGNQDQPQYSQPSDVNSQQRQYWSNHIQMSLSSGLQNPSPNSGSQNGDQNSYNQAQNFGPNTGYGHDGVQQRFQGGKTMFPPPFTNHFVPEGVKSIVRRSEGEYVQGHEPNGHQYSGNFGYGNSPGNQNPQPLNQNPYPPSQSNDASYRQRQFNKPNDAYSQQPQSWSYNYQMNPSSGSPNSYNHQNGNQHQYFHPNTANPGPAQTPFGRPQYSQSSGQPSNQADGYNRNQPSFGGSGIIPPFANHFIPEGVKSMVRRAEGGYIQAHDGNGHQLGVDNGYGNSPGPQNDQQSNPNQYQPSQSNARFYGQVQAGQYNHQNGPSGSSPFHQQSGDQDGYNQVAPPSSSTPNGYPNPDQSERSSQGSFIPLFAEQYIPHGVNSIPQRFDNNDGYGQTKQRPDDNSSAAYEFPVHDDPRTALKDQDKMQPVIPQGNLTNDTQSSNGSADDTAMKNDASDKQENLVEIDVSSSEKLERRQLSEYIPPFANQYIPAGVSSFFQRSSNDE
ncbi:hypothetical protein CROQUDRAFT_133211 [Cronartium quercuum f. sp. fusiforme G11]|uniref:Uncharacterized protein n=1 Tax=Cronartium quercuum f. sp. fusiforme G11 TaxID=708437 RepID=A0A9P6NG25_9BASI|nr:hypothetical protein CROQUDRAFT_133211 [Cronartium quercuum f. sp. fusiforme G11]